MFSFFKKKPLLKHDESEQIQEDYNDVSIIADFFKKETGVTFERQSSILKNKVTTFCKLRDITSFDTLLQSIKNNYDIKQELIDYLTTNETFFYREFKQVQELVELVKKSHKSVNILCAPSATGEEPYSIAIALLEAGIKEHNFKITGIDINSDAIQKAKEAIYKERNIRNLSPQILQRYFTKKDDLYILSEKVKSHVTFKIANIFDSSFKNIGTFDFIFSRNMLIYFDKETKLKAKEILESLRIDAKQDIFFGHADLF